MKESSSSASKVSSAGSVEGEVGATKTEIRVPRNNCPVCICSKTWPYLYTIG